MADKQANHSHEFLNDSFSHKDGFHICLMYRDEEERQKIVSEYIKKGLTNKEKIAYFTDIMSPKQMRSWLDNLGIDHQQIDILPAREVYCPQGSFDPEKMISHYENYHNSAIKSGYSGARITGETSWLNDSIRGSNRFLEYEALINDVIKKYPVTTMCQYDVRLFDGATIFDILQVHPLMIVHGQIVKNPAYINPKDFLEQFHRRQNG